MWESVKALKPYLKHLNGRKRHLVALFCLGLLASAASLASPLVGKTFIDAVTERHDYSVVPLIAAGLVGLALLDLLLGTAVRLVHARLSADILAELRQRLFGRCFDGPLEHIEGFRHGDLMTRFGTDIPQVQGLLVDGLLGGLQNLLFLLAAAAILLTLSVPMALWSFLGVALALIAATMFRRPVEEKSSEIRGIMAELSHYLSERLGAIRQVRFHKMGAEEGRRFSSINARLSDRVVAYQVFDTAASGLPGLTLTVSLAWIYLLGGKYLETGSITLGTFVAFILYQGRLFGPARGMVGLVRSIQESRVAIDRVGEVLGGREQQETTSPAPAPALRPGELRLRGVRFGYHGKPSVLDGLDLSLAPGTKAAVFGLSGIGKSTLIQIIFGLREPTEGTVEIGASGAICLGYAGADPFLLHASAVENIKYGAPGATEGECLRAAQLAEADGFIRELPQGYDTVIGGRGHRLSDGQRQRIGLGRLFLQSPDILVLDEAFSGLDPETEARVRANIAGEFGGKTMLTITHRLGGLTDYDELYIMEEGRLRRVEPLELLEYFSRHGDGGENRFHVGMELPRNTDARPI